MDERERDKFYSPSDPTPDDEEYELEPLDPAIVSAEKRRAQEVAEEVRSSIDIDEVYRDAERNRGTEILENWARNFHYRFHVKHLLIATAVLAIAIAAAKLNFLIPGLTILIVGSIAGLYFYLNWQERKQQAEAYEKRQELYAKRRERFQAKGGTPADDEPLAPIELTPPPAASPPNEAADMWEEPPAPEPLRIRFSLRSLMIALTVAAVSLGIIQYFGGPDPTATILGSIAFVGLIVLALGFEPPQSMILGWWFILLLYVLFTIAGAVL
jgi:small-conductance mechanosensitive channel